MSREKNETTRQRVCISIFQHGQVLLRVRATVHPRRDCIFGIVWSRESDGDRVVACVRIDDGTLLKSYYGFLNVCTDRFSVHITTTVDLACDGGKCMAERYDEAVGIGGGVLSRP